LAKGLKHHIWEKHVKEDVDFVFGKNLILYVVHVKLLNSQEISDDAILSRNPLLDIISPIAQLK
jgi:hypothetical protein